MGSAVDLDLVGQYWGRCCCCGGDARHRIAEAIQERLAAGESVEELAEDYGLTVEVVAALTEDPPAR